MHTSWTEHRNARPTRAEAWRLVKEDLPDGFSTREMRPSELLVDPATDPALDAEATALLARTPAERADAERTRAREGMAAIRAERRGLVADLLAEGRTPADILAIVAMTGADAPAWLIDELRRQAPTG